MASTSTATTLGQFGPAELELLRQAARESTFAAAQEIFAEGAPGDGVYLVRDGQVEISCLVNGDRRQVFGHVGPGELFGEMAVLDDQPRSAAARALRPTTVWFLERERVLELVRQSPDLAFGMLRAISARLREFNRQYIREVLQAERLAIIGRFARSIIHDLKNPLNIIGLKAEMAGFSEATPEVRHRAARDIRSQVDRISDMIGEILEFTQGASRDLVLAPMDYATFVRQVATTLGAEVALKSVTLELVEPLPDAKLLIHPKRLMRVFQNLVHNATDAMPHGGRILLRVLAGDSEVVTELEDSGPGIAPEIAHELFVPFATFGKVHGTGLGLSICRRILEDHRGWISARPAEPHGAVFYFGLPRAGN